MMKLLPFFLAFMSYALPAGAQMAPPIKIGQTIQFSFEVPHHGWEVAGYSCNQGRTVCGNLLKKGKVFYVVTTNPTNYKAGRGVFAQRVVAMSRHTLAKGETAQEAVCYIDNQDPLLVFVSASRRSVRAVLLDKANRFVEVSRVLKQPNYCDFDPG